MSLLTRCPVARAERLRDLQEESEVLRDIALSLAYRASVLREEAAALRAQARQIRRHAQRTRDASLPPVA
jgi:hypothetical protein